MKDYELKQETEFKVVVPALEHPLYMRLHSSDISVYDQVFKHQHYALNILKPVETVVDAGANIGLTSAYLASQYPQARILALEPEVSNFQLLKKNVAPYENVIPIQGALWRDHTQLNLFDSGWDKWGFQTELPEEESEHKVINQVEAWTVEDLMQEYNMNSISLLKIDIEGAEKEVFEASSAWIDRVAVIAVELHDRIKVGCSRSFFSAVGNFQLEKHKGGNVIVAREGWLNVGDDIPPDKCQ